MIEMCKGKNTHAHKYIESVTVPPFIDRNDIAFSGSKILVGYSYTFIKSILSIY